VFRKLHTTSSCVTLLKQVADLARGTFGFVQLAQDLVSGEHVAIKVCFSQRVPDLERSGGVPAVSAGACYYVARSQVFLVQRLSKLCGWVAVCPSRREGARSAPSISLLCRVMC